MVHRSLLIAAFVWLFAEAASAATPSNINDPWGVLQAMQNGDIDALRRLSSNGSDGQKIVAAASLSRVTIDLERSSQQSGDCVRAARGQSDDIVLICGLIDAGNDLAMGRPGQWAKKVAFLRKQLYPSYRKERGNDFTIAPLEYIRDPASFADLPDASYANSGEGGKLELSALSKSTLVPMPIATPVAVDVHFGNTVIKAVLDTGSHMTLLNAPTARQLHLDSRPGWMSGNGLTSNERERMSVAIVPSIQIGPLQARQVAVSITQTSVINLIGLDLIRQLGAIQFKRDEVNILPNSDPWLDTCQTPLRTASTLVPTGVTILVPIQVNGKATWAALDTGNDTFLTRYGGPQPSEPDRLEPGKHYVAMTVNGINRIERRSATEMVDVGDGSHARTVQVEPGKKDAPFYVLGLPGAEAAELLIDFRQRHLCTRKPG